MNRISAEEAVLVAISLGARDAREIASMLNMDLESVEKVLKRLEIKGLVKSELKGFWIFKKTVYTLTDRGFEIAQKSREKLVKIAEEVKRALETIHPHDESAKYQVLQPYMPVLPLLMYMGLLDLAFLTLPLTMISLSDFGEFEEIPDMGDVEFE